MGRAFLLAAALGLSSPAALAQGPGTLRITVTLADAAGTVTPVGRHALLISDEPPSAPPRRIFTTAAGTADVSLRPGRYAVESDQPLAFEGKTYHWSQRIDIVAGRHATIDLTADNASVETRDSSAGPADRSATDPSLLAARWQGSVVALWTPTRHASGFVVDARGLIVTSQRVVGTATSVEAQFTPDLKVTATVMTSDATRDVAVLRVNPSAVAAVPPLAARCGQALTPVANGHELYAIGALMTGQKRLTLGQVTGVGPRLLLSDLTVNRASAGGPVFGADGLIGFTTVDDRDPDGRSNARVVRIDQACEALASAEGKMAGAMPPAATPLPVEPRQPIPVSALGEAVRTRTGNLTPYAMSTSGFEIAFITPVHVYGSNDRPRRPVMEFGTWSEYLADYPRVLLVRVTPKMVEGLWAKVARGAAMTQGIALPPITRAKAGFSRMRASCGAAEVTPIHPFLIEQRLSATDAIYEGLYVFDPAALGPQCGTVTLTIYSEQDPGRGDTRVVDPKVLQQVAADFAPLQ